MLRCFWFILENRGVGALSSAFVNNQTVPLSFTFHQRLQNKFLHRIRLDLLSHFHFLFNKFILNRLFNKLCWIFNTFLSLFLRLNHLFLISIHRFGLLNFCCLYLRRCFLFLARILGRFCIILQVNSKGFMAFSGWNLSWNVRLYPFATHYLLRYGD